MSPDEAIAYMELIRDKAAKAAPDCAMAMGQTHQKYLKDVTLSQYGHAPQTWTGSPARTGTPGLISGQLRDSVTCVRGAGGGMYASSLVGPHTIYARVQVEGAIIRAHRRVRGGWTGRYLGGIRGPGQHTLHFIQDGEDYFPMAVEVPARPYMQPSRDAVIRNGSVQEAGSAAFLRQVFG